MSAVRIITIFVVGVCLLLLAGLAPVYAAEPVQQAGINDQSVLQFEERMLPNHQFRTLDVFVPDWRGEYTSFELSNAMMTEYRPMQGYSTGHDELAIPIAHFEN